MDSIFILATCGVNATQVAVTCRQAHYTEAKFRSVEIRQSISDCGHSYCLRATAGSSAASEGLRKASTWHVQVHDQFNATPFEVIKRLRQNLIFSTSLPTHRANIVSLYSAEFLRQVSVCFQCISMLLKTSIVFGVVCRSRLQSWLLSVS